MLRRLLDLISPPGRGLPAGSREFIAALANAEVWVLATGLRGVPSVPASLSDSGTIDLIAAHAVELDDLTDDDSVFPFNCERGGAQVLPFFTTEARAQSFLAGGYAGDNCPFQPYRLLAGFVTSRANDGLVPVLDAGSPGEREFGPAERRLLRRLARPRAPGA